MPIVYLNKFYRTPLTGEHRLFRVTLRAEGPEKRNALKEGKDVVEMTDMSLARSREGNVF